MVWRGLLHEHAHRLFESPFCPLRFLHEKRHPSPHHHVADLCGYAALSLADLFGHVFGDGLALVISLAAETFAEALKGRPPGERSLHELPA